MVVKHFSLNLVPLPLIPVFHFHLVIEITTYYEGPWGVEVLHTNKSIPKFKIISLKEKKICHPSCSLFLRGLLLLLLPEKSLLVLLDRSIEGFLFCSSLERTMTQLAAGIDEMKVDLFLGNTLGLHTKRLEKRKWISYLWNFFSTNKKILLIRPIINNHWIQTILALFLSSSVVVINWQCNIFRE